MQLDQILLAFDDTILFSWPIHTTIPSISALRGKMRKRHPLPLLIDRELTPLGWMEKGLLIINGVRTEKPIAGIAQTRKDLALVVELVIDGANGDANVGVGINQLLEAVAAGNDAQDVNLGNAPLSFGREGLQNMCQRCNHAVVLRPCEMKYKMQ